MSSSKDRPLMRDAILAGVIIAVGGISALIALDRKPVSRSYPDAVMSPEVSIKPGAPAPSTLTIARHPAAALNAGSQQSTDPAKSKKKKSDDMTLLVMVPDLPHETANPPPTGVWSDQGSPGSTGNSGPAGLVALASTTGQPSLPLTSPSGSTHAAIGNGNDSPGIAGIPVPPPVGHPAVGNSLAGFVLITGGQSSGKFALATAELYDPATATFSAASPMKVARTDHTATMLAGARILVAGGVNAEGHSLSSAELYSPATGEFTSVSSAMRAARSKHSATLIAGCGCPADGKVLLAGGVAGVSGQTLRSAELFDPATNKFTATGAMKSTRALHSATLIGSGPLAGQVLIAGGTSDESGGDVTTAELYDPATGQFSATGAMAAPREEHTATWLDPAFVKGSLAGKVLIAGGGDPASPTDTAEVFDPQTGSFSPVGTMTTRRTLHVAALLSNGSVLIAGGQSAETSFPISAELFDPAKAAFLATGPMSNVHVGGTATVLENGRVLVAGGRSSFGDLYDPGAGTFAATGKMVTEVAESASSLIR
ncbi:MAG TPA: kelch repeat-containing protein [Candidatus Acidoferrales bacterium]|nr:kelch repeat-containing protein [Candidatus Acidoferrales bacterium]